MQLTSDDLARLADGNVVGPDGDKIGGVGQIYTDDQSGEPAWVTVKTGLFGSSESFVPLAGANLSGDDIRVNFDKAKVKDAPRVEADGSITPEEEDTLYSYYGLSGPDDTASYTSGRGADHDRGADDRGADLGADDRGADDRGADDRGADDRGADLGADDRGADLGADDRGADLGADDRGADLGADDRGADLGADDRGADRDTVGRDTSGPNTDDAMTLSEERVQVGTQRREAGRARLRKYVTTENVTKTVPVSREEVRVEREPITDANVGDATSGTDISEEEHEVTLHEEVPVVQKETVPTERVRLNTETVTDETTVTEEVRKENVDTDTDTDTDTDRRR